MLISVAYIKKARKYRQCLNCGNPLHRGKSYVDLYGAAYECEKPWHLYLCLKCAANASRKEIRDILPKEQKPCEQK